jgi:hypothetical protein
LPDYVLVFATPPVTTTSLLVSVLATSAPAATTPLLVRKLVAATPLVA